MRHFSSNICLNKCYKYLINNNLQNLKVGEKSAFINILIQIGYLIISELRFKNSESSLWSSRQQARERVCQL